MNATIFKENVFDMMVGENPKIFGYREFKEAIESLDDLTSIDLYIERRVDTPKERTLSKIGNAFQNTADTLERTLKAYDDATDGGGAFLKGVADLTGTAIGFAAKVIKFIFENLGSLLVSIDNLIRRTMSIPEVVRAKVRGNIRLNIEAHNFERFYNESFVKISNFISLASAMSKGETWGTFFGNVKKAIDGDKVPENDMNLYKKMKIEFDYINQIRFEPSEVRLDKKEIVDIYFGGSKSITFKDLRGNSHETSYFEGLRSLMKDLESQKKPLNVVYELLTQKFSKSQANNSFARLNTKQQKHVSESIQMVSKVVAIIGNLVKYTLEDINTFGKNVNKMLEHRGITPVNNDVNTKEKVQKTNKQEKPKTTKVDILDKDGNKIGKTKAKSVR